MSDNCEINILITVVHYLTRSLVVANTDEH